MRNSCHYYKKGFKKGQNFGNSLERPKLWGCNFFWKKTSFLNYSPHLKVLKGRGILHHLGNIRHIELAIELTFRILWTWTSFFIIKEYGEEVRLRLHINVPTDIHIYGYIAHHIVGNNVMSAIQTHIRTSNITHNT
jgi:hypothetical protein